jgi:uncharacterized protein YkwD
MATPRRPSFALLSCFLALASACSDADADDDNADVTEYCSAQRSWNSEWASDEDEVLALVNQRRSEGANCGGQSFASAAPLTMSRELRCAARNHSADMALNGFFSHTNSAGESFTDRVDKTGYEGFAQGENIASGYSSPDQVMSGWMDSPGHCANIMNPNHTEIGIGLWAEGNLWTQVMGRE